MDEVDVASLEIFVNILEKRNTVKKRNEEKINGLEKKALKGKKGKTRMDSYKEDPYIYISVLKQLNG